MRMTAVVLIAAIFGPASSSWAGQQPATPLNPQNDSKMRDLEAKARQLVQEMTLQRASRHKPTINCGLTLVSPDPEHDAKIRIPPPQGATPTIRRVTPSVCRADQKPQLDLPALPRR